MFQILGFILCAGLTVWGVRQIRDPEKVVRRKYPDAQVIPKLMLRNTRMKGITCAAVGAAGVLYLLGVFLNLI